MSAKKRIRVLITGSGTVTCQSIIKALRQQDELDAYIVTTDANPESAGRYFSNAFYTTPLAGDENFLPTILDIIRKEQVQLLIPIVDYEFDKIAGAVTEFAELGCQTAISSPESIAKCNEKEKTFRFFAEIGLNTPVTHLPHELSGLSSLQFPLFIKPRTGRASLDTYKICNQEELDYYLELVDDPVIQEFVAGREYTIDVLADFNHRVLGIVPRRRLETKVGISYKGRTVDDDRMISDAKYIAEKIELVGHCNIQLFVDDDRYCYFEINPRYSGTLTLTTAAGLNSPLLLCKSALGEEIEPTIGKYKKDLLMLRYWEEVFVNPDGSVLQIPKLI